MDVKESELLNTIFLGEVASVQNYGAFVRIPGNSSQGLVHRSQVSSAAVEDVTEVLQRGERVWCKVINIMEDGKIGLSMKVVNQGNGIDLDPNGVQMHQDEQKRKSMPSGGGRRKITLDAVYKTTCSKCGITGHLAKDCFQSAGGKVYELIPEDDIISDLPLTSNQATLSEDKKRSKAKKRKHSRVKKERKKEKKKHKKEEKKRNCLDHHQSEEESDVSRKQEKKKKSKRARSRSKSPQRKRKNIPKQ